MNIIVCYSIKCRHHPSHKGEKDPFCYKQECQFEPLVPAGYTEEELERDNPYDQWMYEK